MYNTLLLPLLALDGSAAYETRLAELLAEWEEAPGLHEKLRISEQLTQVQANYRAAFPHRQLHGPLGARRAHAA